MRLVSFTVTIPWYCCGCYTKTEMRLTRFLFQMRSEPVCEHDSLQLSLSTIIVLILISSIFFMFYPLFVCLCQSTMWMVVGSPTTWFRQSIERTFGEFNRHGLTSRRIILLTSATPITLLAFFGTIISMFAAMT